MNASSESLQRLDRALSALEAGLEAGRAAQTPPAIDADQAIAIETARMEARAMSRDRERLSDVLETALAEHAAMQTLIGEARSALDDAIDEVRQTLALLGVRRGGPDPAGD